MEVRKNCDACGSNDLCWSYVTKSDFEPLIVKSEKCRQCNKVFKQELITEKEFLDDPFKDFKTG